METTTVKTLIGVLKTERDALDRAIFHLEQIEKPAVSVDVPAKVSRKARHKSKVFLSDDTKRAIVADMERVDAQAGNLSVTAKQLALRYGAVANTINASWRRWQTDLKRTNGAASQPTTELETATV